MDRELDSSQLRYQSRFASIECLDRYAQGIIVVDWANEVGDDVDSNAFLSPRNHRYVTRCFVGDHKGEEECQGANW